MQWSGLGQSRAAVIGYNADAYFLNHPSSGFDAVADIVSCGVGQKRRKRQTGGVRPLYTKMPVLPEVKAKSDECQDRYTRDILATFLDDTEQTNILAYIVSQCPCPPTSEQAIRDRARFLQLSQSPLCFVSTKPNCEGMPIFNNIFVVTAAHQCCYRGDG
jgi:hypothetical protein